VRSICIGLLLVAAAPAFAAQDVVLVLDNSGSMRTNDPERMAGKAVTQFVDAQGLDSHLSIIMFSTSPTVLTSLASMTNENRAAATAAVDKLDYRGQWTDIGAALERALYELDTHGRPDAEKYVVLMTDGYVDVGNPVRDSDKIHWIKESLIPEAVAKHVRIFGIAFTDTADFELMQTLAQRTGAGYYRAYKPDDLGDVYKHISDALQTGQPAAAPEEPPAATAAAVPGQQQAFAFNTPLTRMQQVEEDSRRAMWIWIIVVLLLAFLGAGGYFIWSKGLIKTLLKRTEKAAPAQSDGLQAVLYDISNPNDIKRYELGELATVIGRVAGYDPEVQYVLASEPTVGRCHALIERRGHAFWITDQGSINGTFVNGDRVNADRALKHGDIISIHRHEFEFVLPELFESESTVLAAREELGYAERR
jgi:hypothetical protein